MTIPLTATRCQRTFPLHPYILLLVAQVTLVFAQIGPSSWSASPFNPPSYPLAVRSPYLNSWIPQGNGPAALNTVWPQHWPKVQGNNLGWFCAVQVDGTTYRLMGSGAVPQLNLSSQTSVEFTPTRTTYIQRAGPVDVNMTFWSPIEPKDVVRQSFPGIYLGVSVNSVDGAAHNVMIYSDISGEWITGDIALLANWTNTATGDLVYHTVQLQSPSPFSEDAEFAQDATAFYGMEQRPGLTYMIGTDQVVRTLFNSSGALANTIDTNFRGVGNNFPVFGLSVALGQVVSTDADSMVVYSLALLRNPAVRYMNQQGVVELRAPAFLSQYSSIQNALEAFIKDFPRARDATSAFDAQLLSAASAVSPAYANLLSLVARQIMGSSEITMGRASDGSWNQSDVMMFVKDMGGLGAQARGVNAVDVLYASFPSYIYLNPDMGAWALRPLLMFQNSPLYPQQYAAVDIGGPYPNAIGNPTAHNQGVEQCANMLIMVLAQAQASGSNELIGQFYPLLKKWGDYLVTNANALANGSQVTADSVVGSNIPQFNQTNLAIKGALGIAAAAKISQAAGMGDDAKTFQDASSKMVTDWVSLAVASDGSRLLANFNQPTSSAMMYNLFADKWLQLNAVPDSVYQIHTAFVSNAAASSQYGVPLSSFDPQLSRSDWSMFTAATMTNINTRNVLVTQLQNYASPNMNNTPFAVLYNPTNAQVQGGMNSAAQGAIFSLLALNQTIRAITAPGTSSGTGSSTGAVVGGVIAGVVVLGVLAYVAFFLYRRRRQQRYADAIKPTKRGDIVSGLAPGTYEPFTVGMPDGGASMSQVGQYAPMLRQQSNEGVSVSSPLLPGDSVYGRSMGMQGTVFPAGAAVAGGFAMGHRAEDSRGSAYFRRQGSVSDLGPSASQVEPVDPSTGARTRTGSSASPGTGTTSSPFFVRNASRSDISGASATAPSNSTSATSQSQSQALLHKQTAVQDELRTEVENLRREMDRLREERFIAGSATIESEAPPSYNHAAR